MNPSDPEPALVQAPDDGLRQVLTWTFIALGVTLVLAAIGVTLAVYWFDPGA
ncbi:MAG: hypothetical protein H0X67_18170 [Acidobacteria bacterium]|nr:hypothetical protein [Acidobacteriota bacterium]